MTTIDEIKAVEGKRVMVWTKHGSIYIGKMTNPRPPKDHEEGVTAAYVEFDYKRYHKVSTTEGPQKMLTEEREENFPVSTEDIIYGIGEK